MATNPSNAVGTNGAYPGRTSVNAFNDCLGVYAGRGILSGFHISANSGMSVSIGGNGLVRDVAIAEDNRGNRTTINNISGAPITVNIPAAPTSGSRYDSIVAYVVNPPVGLANVVDNPGACGLIVVSGQAIGTGPVLASDAEIRNAITLDSGASGETAYYVVLGEVLVASGTTNITVAMITQETQAILSGSKVIDGTLNGSAITDATVDYDKLDNSSLKSQWHDYTGSVTLTYPGTDNLFVVGSDSGLMVANIAIDTPGAMKKEDEVIANFPAWMRPAYNVNFWGRATSYTEGSVLGVYKCYLDAKNGDLHYGCHSTVRKQIRCGATWLRAGTL